MLDPKDYLARKRVNAQLVGLQVPREAVEVAAQQGARAAAFRDSLIRTRSSEPGSPRW